MKIINRKLEPQEENDNVFICKYYHDRGLQPGKMWADESSFYIYKDGKIVGHKSGTYYVGNNGKLYRTVNNMIKYGSKIKEGFIK